MRISRLDGPGRLIVWTTADRVSRSVFPGYGHGGALAAPMAYPWISRWRIAEADIWDRERPDPIGPATMTIAAAGRGETAFG